MPAASFVLDMGEPVRIADLAEQIIRLAGKRPYEDVDIEFVGLRTGEKLYEELFHDAESLVADRQRPRSSSPRRAWPTATCSSAPSTN